MIEFASLFLGFVLGVQPVELAVDARVVAVVLELDGHEIARLEGPPWRADVDFGSKLEPRRLEAVACDADGRRIERVGMVVNYSRADYGASLVLDAYDEAGYRTGRLLWEAVLDQDPVRVDLRFDGEPLPVDLTGRFVLPRHDARESHYLTAELTFADGQQLRPELSFGGRFGERLTSALTAVPLRSAPGRPWRREEIEGWIERDGRGVDVFAARAEEGTLLVVRSERVDKPLKRLARRRGEVRGFTAGPRGPERAFELTAVLPRPLKAHKGTFELLRLGRVDGRTELSRLLWLDPSSYGRQKRRRREHLWDAVALAGRHASSANRPRAVLLMVGHEIADTSALSRAQATHYLESVRVPLFVWAPDAEALAALAVGAPARLHSGVAGLDQLIGDIFVELASQTLVWLEGEHLPGELRLSGRAPRDLEWVR